MAEESILLKAGEGRPVRGGGGLAKAVGEQTGGGYALRELFLPAGRAIPRHVHAREGEAWYVIEGELTFSLDPEEFVAGPASFVHLPAGVAHGVRNSGSDVCRYLQIFSPAGLERYFDERELLERYGEPGRDYAGLTREEHFELAEKYGLTFLDD
ncbi:MAG TPA: cupin domain-containing protein [Dehalococcoidia bacterium]|nr:cupin domain-containing protein [Dehalococcoidia bacterium]